MTSVPAPTTEPATPIRLAVIAGSARKDGLARILAVWAAGLADSRFTIDLIDVAEIELPDDSLLESGGSVVSRVAHRIGAADAYLFVVPEYNHSYPAPLKRLIDWHFTEWRVKPATVISYGTQGGLLATEHLRGVLAELHVVTIRRMVGLYRPWDRLEGNHYRPDLEVTQAVEKALDQLAWWAEALRTARQDGPAFPA